MKITKYLCDKCRKEIKTNQIYKATVQKGLDGSNYNDCYESFHLCEKCTKILLEWVKDNE